MRKPEGVVVYRVQLKKNDTTMTQAFLASNFALLADDLTEWEKENYTVVSIENLGDPIVLAPIRVHRDPASGFN
jgi:hypothetical protein